MNLEQQIKVAEKESMTQNAEEQNLRKNIMKQEFCFMKDWQNPKLKQFLK